MPDEIADWKQIAAALHVALPQIDQALSQANVPISRRKLKAFDIVQETMLDVPDPKAFLLSEAHGRILIIIGSACSERHEGNCSWLAPIYRDDRGGGESRHTEERQHLWDECECWRWISGNNRLVHIGPGWKRMRATAKGI